MCIRDRIKTEEKQNSNAAGLVYEKILNLLATGEAMDFKLGSPKPLSQLGLTGADNFINANPGRSIVGFDVKVISKEGFLENAESCLLYTSRCV